jgi:hypothetical protein
MQTPRTEVYAAIDGERSYQESFTVANSYDGVLSIGEELLLIHSYLDDAVTAWRHEAEPEMAALHIVRKLAGISVRCMENHGAPVRKWAVAG